MKKAFLLFLSAICMRIGMKKTNFEIKLLVIAFIIASLTACNKQKDSSVYNIEPTVTPIVNSDEALKNEDTEASSALSLDNANTIHYQNIDIGFTLEFPASWEGKYIIEENKFNLLSSNAVSIYHKATMDEMEGVGWLGSFGRIPGYYTADWPPVMSGWCPILEYKNGFTYYYNSPSDVQFNADETGAPISDAAKEYVEMRDQLGMVMDSLVALDTWVKPDDAIDKSGMNLYWQENINYFNKDEDAKISLYTSAILDDKNNFVFDDSQHWLLVFETAIGDYPIFPRMPVQLGKVSCQVFNASDKDIYDATTILVTVSQSAGHMIYECTFDSESNAFKVTSVYYKYINYFTESPN